MEHWTNGAENLEGISDVALFLQHTLMERIRRNPHYSLRAFAGSLKIDPSLLSKILRGKRRISRKVFDVIQESLTISPTQIELFRQNLNTSRTEQQNYQHVSLDHFHIISDWYHYGIYELMRVKGFKSDPRWVSKALGISPLEARLAFARLERVGLISKTKEGWQRTPNNISNVKEGYTASALRKLQRHVLEKALDALENTPIEDRDQSSITMAIDSRLIPAARKKIAQFRREFSDFLQQTGEFDEVYHLSVSLYPVSTIKKKKGKHL